MPAIRIRIREIIIAIAAIAVLAAFFRPEAHKDPVLFSVVVGALIVGALVQLLIYATSRLDLSRLFRNEVKSSNREARVEPTWVRFHIRTIMVVIAAVAALLGVARALTTSGLIEQAGVQELTLFVVLKLPWPVRELYGAKFYDAKVSLTDVVGLVATTIALVFIMVSWSRYRRSRHALASGQPSSLEPGARSKLGGQESVG